VCRMDFTFDNPFEDVFTDPNAVAPQQAPVQPVQVAVVPVQPVQNVIVPSVAAVVPPVVHQPAYNPALNVAVSNPEPQPVATQSFVSPAHNTASVAQQIYTPPAATQNPAMVQQTVPGTCPKGFSCGRIGARNFLHFLPFLIADEMQSNMNPLVDIASAQ